MKTTIRMPRAMATRKRRVLRWIWVRWRGGAGWRGGFAALVLWGGRKSFFFWARGQRGRGAGGRSQRCWRGDCWRDRRGGRRRWRRARPKWRGGVARAWGRRGGPWRRLRWWSEGPVGGLRRCNGRRRRGSLHQDQALRCTCCTGLSRPCEFPMRGVRAQGSTWRSERVSTTIL